MRPIASYSIRLEHPDGRELAPLGSRRAPGPAVAERTDTSVFAVRKRSRGPDRLHLRRPPRGRRQQGESRRVAAQPAPGGTHADRASRAEPLPAEREPELPSDRRRDRGDSDGADGPTAGRWISALGPGVSRAHARRHGVHPAELRAPGCSVRVFPRDEVDRLDIRAAVDATSPVDSRLPLLRTGRLVERRGRRLRLRRAPSGIAHRAIRRRLHASP